MPPGQLSYLQKEDLRLKLDQLNLPWLEAAGGEGGVQPSPGLDSKGEGSSRPTTSEDKAMQSCDCRNAFDDAQGATRNKHCTSPVTEYSKLLRLQCLTSLQP